MNEKEIRDKYKWITEKLIEHNLTITTMESCTSGQIASLITDVEGASQVLKGAFVTYSNEAKIQNGVPKEIIDTYGVYSIQTAIHMAQSCKRLYNTNIGVGITGTFGNVDPNNADSVARIVYVSIQYDNKIGPFNYKYDLEQKDSRYEYKLETAYHIANVLIKLINEIEKK